MYLSSNIILTKVRSVITHYLVFGICLFAYCGLSLLSRDPFGISPGVWIGTAFVVSFFIFHLFFVGNRQVDMSGKLVFFGAVLFHCLGVLGEPFLEDDFYRYLWDGYQFFEFGTPYGKAPEEFFGVANVPEQFQRILGQINYPWVPTIYGPTLQYFFLLNHIFSPGDVDGLQLLFSGINLILIAILLRHAKPAAVMLYAWNPLVIKEIAFTAHTDGIVAALVFVAVLLLCFRKRSVAAAILAIAVASKVIALLFVPFLILYSRPVHWLIFIVVLLGLYFPLMAQSGSEMGGLSTFAQHWEFNPSLYGLAKQVMSSENARIAMALTYILGYTWYLLMYLKQTRHWLIFPRQIERQCVHTRLPIPRGDWVLMGLLLVSPVVNAWYLIWLLPFAVIYPRSWSWGFSAIVSLSYFVSLYTDNVQGDIYELPVWVAMLEYGSLFLLLFFSLVSRMRKSGRSKN